MPFASCLSEHPVSSLAAGEVIGSVLETLGDRPDLAVLTVTRPHLGALEDIAATVESVLHPMVMIGCAAESVVGTGREVEETPAVSLWTARVGPSVPVTLRVDGPPGDRRRLIGWPEHLAFEPSALVLVADPYTFPTDWLLAWLADRHPGLAVGGGNASAGRGPGGTRLVTGGRTISEGAVGVLIGGGVEVEPVVSQGARPYGRSFTVTRSDRNLLQEVAGTPAVQALVDQISTSLSSEEVTGMESGGFHIGLLVDEHLDQPDRGDYLVRTLMGVDHRTGALSLDGPVPVGSTVRFHRRDAVTARLDLVDLLAGRRADGALVFTCNGRGTRFFDEADHDAAALADRFGPVAVGGFFAAGEFGPVGGVNVVHTFAASMVLFRDR